MLIELLTCVSSSVPDESDRIHGHLRLHSAQWEWGEGDLLSDHTPLSSLQPLLHRRLLPKQRRLLPHRGKCVPSMDISSRHLHHPEHLHPLDLLGPRKSSSCSRRIVYVFFFVKSELK